MDIELLKKLSQQSKNKSFEYDDIKYIGTEVPSGCFTKLKHEIIDKLKDSVFEPYILVLENALGPGLRFSTLRDFQISILNNKDFVINPLDEQILSIYDLDAYVVMAKHTDNEWHAFRSFDSNDFNNVYKFIRQIWG